MTDQLQSPVIDFDQLPGNDAGYRFDGHAHDANVSFFISRNRPGTGPELHSHPYEETFIVQDGAARFTLGDETIEVTAGKIVVVPAGTPHKFECCGSGRLQQISIHPVARMESEWVDPSTRS